MATAKRAAAKSAATIDFRDPSVTFYGPHPCEQCGKEIVRTAQALDGQAFEVPTGTIYPNTPWPVHAHAGVLPFEEPAESIAAVRDADVKRKAAAQAATKSIRKNAATR